MKNFLIIFILISIVSCEDNVLLKDTIIDKDLILELVNKVRINGCNCGDEEMSSVHIVIWDNKLEEAAKINTDHMYNYNDYNHTWSDGTTLTDRYKMVGFNTWKGSGENIAYGKTIEQVFQFWLDKPGHCKNIMHKNHKRIGVARTGNFWSMNFISE